MQGFLFREPVNTWTHLIWMLLAVPGTVLLWQRSRGDRGKQVSLLIFGLGLIICFGSSALFHGLWLSPVALEPFIALDHIGIYLLIAATCTGMVYTLLRGAWKWTILGVVWGTALLGIACRLTALELPRWVNPSVYLFMGWALASCYPQLVRAVGVRPVRLVWLGGLLYSMGALCYMLRWPVIWPGVVGWHESLHLCDMGGSLVHFWFVLKYVVPYQRVPVVVPATAELKPALAYAPSPAGAEYYSGKEVGQAFQPDSGRKSGWKA